MSYSYYNTGKFNTLLSKISDAIPNFSLLKGKLPTPVIFIDECQELNRIIREGNGQVLFPGYSTQSNEIEFVFVLLEKK